MRLHVRIGVNFEIAELKEAGRREIAHEASQFL